GKKPAPTACKITKPAAKARPRLMRYWRATAAAGGSSARPDGIQRQSPCDCGGRLGSACEGRREPHRGKDRGKSRPRRDLPDRWIEPERTLSIARDASLAKTYSVGSRALVHRRRALCPGDGSLEQHGDGAADFSRRLRAGRQHPPHCD